MWTFEYQHPTTASPDAVWRLWSDVARWPEWDSDLEIVTLDRDFSVGATGSLKPKGMDPFPFTITRAEPGRGYADETPLPGATLRFDHDLLETEDGAVIRQRVTVDGPAANDHFAQFARSIVLDIPGSLERFAAQAERTAA
jgi:hypothetical protein